MEIKFFRLGYNYNATVFIFTVSIIIYTESILMILMSKFKLNPKMALIKYE